MPCSVCGLAGLDNLRTPCGSHRSAAPLHPPTAPAQPHPLCTHLPIPPFVTFPNPQDWEWSPAAPDATLAAYQAEQGNLPARVVLMKLPSREELRQKNLFSVAGELLLICVCLFLCGVCSG